jgi:hypothetical protein
MLRSSRGFSKGTVRSKRTSTKVYIDVFTPMPRASVRRTIEA